MAPNQMQIDDNTDQVHEKPSSNTLLLNAATFDTNDQHQEYYCFIKLQVNTDYS
jgi:hypothetical protein